MKCVYDSLPRSFSQAFLEVTQEAEIFGIDADVLQDLLVQPLVSDHFSEAQEITNQRMDPLREACRKDATKIMRLLSHLSFCGLERPKRRGRGRVSDWCSAGTTPCWFIQKKAINQT